jgi:glycerate kinase
VIGVGGTASSDGGAGALRALGLKYFDKAGREISEKPIEMIRLNRVDWSGFDRRVYRSKIYVMCDVKNPLLGSNGSAKTFGPQKGANSNEVDFLEKTLRLWSRFSKKNTTRELGSGAAGGMAFGLSGFAGAHLVRGSNFIIEMLNWVKFSRRTDVIIAGEGQLDLTSFRGKVIDAICKKRAPTKVYAVCGTCVLPKKFLKIKGISGVIQMGSDGMTHPKHALKEAAKKLIDMILKDNKLCKQ